VVVGVVVDRMVWVWFGVVVVDLESIDLIGKMDRSDGVVLEYGLVQSAG